MAGTRTSRPPWVWFERNRVVVVMMMMMAVMVAAVVLLGRTRPKTSKFTNVGVLPLLLRGDTQACGLLCEQRASCSAECRPAVHSLHALVYRGV